MLKFWAKRFEVEEVVVKYRDSILEITDVQHMGKTTYIIVKETGR
jgi:hypothetical protein